MSKSNCKPTKPWGVTKFTHYRNGKTYYAKDYGHDCWPIGRKKR
jgi:hypothetical protein